MGISYQSEKNDLSTDPTVNTMVARARLSDLWFIKKRLAYVEINQYVEEVYLLMKSVGSF